MAVNEMMNRTERSGNMRSFFCCVRLEVVVDCLRALGAVWWGGHRLLILVVSHRRKRDLNCCQLRQCWPDYLPAYDE
eukprot:scaffold582_cov107-Skeletonema_dohrnii-CCMP3373.AAC.3